MPDFSGTIQAVKLAGDKDFTLDNGMHLTLTKKTPDLVARLGGDIGPGTQVSGKYYNKKFDDGNEFNFVSAMQVSVSAPTQSQPAPSAQPVTESGTDRKADKVWEIFTILLEHNCKVQGMDFVTSLDDHNISKGVAESLTKTACLMFDSAVKEYKDHYGGK